MGNHRHRHRHHHRHQMHSPPVPNKIQFNPILNNSIQFKSTEHNSSPTPLPPSSFPAFPSIPPPPSAPLLTQQNNPTCFPLVPHSPVLLVSLYNTPTPAPLPLPPLHPPPRQRNGKMAGGGVRGMLSE